MPAALSAAGCLVAKRRCTALLLSLILMQGGICGPGLTAVRFASGCSAAMTCCTAVPLLLRLMHWYLWAPVLKVRPPQDHYVEALLAQMSAPAELPVTAQMKLAPAACNLS